VDPGPVAVSPLVRNGTWAHALTVLHAAARESDRRAERTPSRVVIDTHLARGAANGGSTFHDRGSPYGRTKGARRVIAVDVTGLPVAALVVLASTHENRTSELILEHLSRQGVTDRLELVLVDRGARPPRPLPAPGEVVREHHHLGDRLAPGRLHRHHAARAPTGGEAMLICAPSSRRGRRVDTRS
jgi:hypothetical protein